MTEQQLREEMVQIGASLFSRGYATGSAGNLSLLLPDGNLLATPTGACLGELQAQRLSVVTLQGEWISGDKPSKEVTFHRAVYLHNPACKAIVHLHSHYLTALSCLQGLDPHNCIRPFTPYVVMRVGDVPVVPYYRPGDDRIAQALAGLAPAQIQGEEIRVTGKSRDDLQSVMALVRGGDLGQPFQFKNFRD